MGEIEKGETEASPGAPWIGARQEAAGQQQIGRQERAGRKPQNLKVLFRRWILLEDCQWKETLLPQRIRYLSLQQFW